jgi:hypothetical protein
MGSRGQYSSKDLIRNFYVVHEGLEWRKQKSKYHLDSPEVELLAIKYYCIKPEEEEMLEDPE